MSATPSEPTPSGPEMSIPFSPAETSRSPSLPGRLWAGLKSSMVLGWAMFFLTVLTGGVLFLIGKLHIDLPRPPRYEASAVLHISPQPKYILFPPQPGPNDPSHEAYSQSQAALLKSPHVLNAVLRGQGVSELAMIRRQADPAKWLERNVQVDFPQGPEYMRVSLVGNDPDELTMLLNRVVDNYLGERASIDHSLRSLRIQQLRIIAHDYKEKAKYMQELKERIKLVLNIDQEQGDLQHMEEIARKATREAEMLDVEQKAPTRVSRVGEITIRKLK